MAQTSDRGEKLELEAALTELYGFVPRSIGVKKLKGDASTRSYYRLQVSECKPGSLIAMCLPADALSSDEATGGEQPEELPFLNLQRMLSERGLPVPELYAIDMRNGVLLLEDLGDETFAERLARLPAAEWPATYGQAVDLLVRLHRDCDRPQPGCIAYSRRFDSELLRWELDHFRQWGLEELHGPLAGADRARLDDGFERIVLALLAMPAGFVHRDYQSRNLMWAKGPAGERLVIIDFQDALLGPVPYDLVALLCDSYLDLDLDLQLEMIERYIRGRELSPDQAAAFHQRFWTVAVHRKLKDAGRFVFIDRARGNPDFLPHFPQSLRYVGRALNQLEGLGGSGGLKELLERLVPGFPEQIIGPEAIKKP